MDTRFWGPSGWQLFHLIAFTRPNAREVLDDMKDVLPCKYCRASTTEFVSKNPPCGDLGKWLYDIHNQVNTKLRKQAADDPKVINPGPDPSFEEVKAKYAALKTPDAVPGRDFLMAIAYNFPGKPEPRDMSTQREFLHHLAETYPYDNLRAIVQTYLKKREPALTSQRAYTHWMYDLMVLLSKAVKVDIRSYNGYMSHLAYYKSGCKGKTYKGKTCRRVVGGGYTKNRNPDLTRRITTRSLLGRRKTKRVLPK
jgi:hypothetical protein